MLIHQLPLEAAFAALRGAPAGLSRAEAALRRVEFGPNRIEGLPSTPLVVRLLRQFTHFFAVLLLLAALLALIADWWMPGQGMATLAAAMVAVILINGAFSFWQEYRAERTMAALRRLLPHQVRVLRDGATVIVPSEDIVPGDVIFLTAGDDVPADCRLIEAFGTRVNNATVTGEGRPVSRDTHGSSEPDVLRSRNVVLAGTVVTSGEATALVFATGMHTAFGRIAHLTQTTVDMPSPLQREIATLSRLIAALAVALGLIVFAIGGQRPSVPQSPQVDSVAAAVRQPPDHRGHSRRGDVDPRRRLHGSRQRHVRHRADWIPGVARRRAVRTGHAAARRDAQGARRQT